LFRVQEGDEHVISVREHCSNPVLYKGSPITVHLPCDEPCELFMNDAEVFVNGYVNLTSEANPSITYFAGAPSSDTSEPGLVSFSVCSGDIKVNIVLPETETVSPDSHHFVVVHNDTQEVVATESGWSIPDSSIVWNTSKDGSGVFEFVCVSCYPATVANYSLVLRDDGNETLQLTGVRSHYGYVWISTDDKDPVEYGVGPDKSISIDFDNVNESYCFAYGTCENTIDRNSTICLESFYCHSLNISFVGYDYSPSEYLNIQMEAVFFEPLIEIDYIKIIVNGSNESLDITPDDVSSPAKLEFNITEDILLSILDKNVCIVYSFTGCGGKTFSNVDDPLCTFLEKKSILPLVLGCVFGGLFAALALSLLILFLIKRPRGEGKEVSIEMEFPEDMEPEMDGEEPYGNPNLSSSPSLSESNESKSASASSSSAASSAKSGSAASSVKSGKPSASDEENNKSDDNKSEDGKDSDKSDDDKDSDKSDDDKESNKSDDDKESNKSDDDKESDKSDDDESDDEDVSISSASDED